MHYDMLTCFHALPNNLNVLTITFAQHGTADNVTPSSIVPFHRGIDGDVTASNSDIDSNVMAPYALNLGVTFLSKDARRMGEGI